MLNTSRNALSRNLRARRQRGVSLVISLMVLVVLTLSGIALIRSMDTTNLIAGNLSFKQAATQGADQGVEAAIAWLGANNNGALSTDLVNGFYTASSIGNDAIAALGSGTAEDFWMHYTNNDSASVPCYLPMSTSGLVGGSVCAGAPTRDPASGNIVGFIIQRLCTTAGNVNGAGCSVPINTASGVGGVVSGNGNNEGAGDISTTSGAITASTMVYYRITVRSQGLNNTVSYVQAIVAMGSS